MARHRRHGPGPAAGGRVLMHCKPMQRWTRRSRTLDTAVRISQVAE
jgi:hypothetical protein